MGKTKTYEPIAGSPNMEAAPFGNLVPTLGVFVEPSAMSVNEYLDRWLRDAARASYGALLMATPDC